MTVMTHVKALQAGHSSQGHLSLLHRNEANCFVVIMGVILVGDRYCNQLISEHDRIICGTTACVACVVPNDKRNMPFNITIFLLQIYSTNDKRPKWME